MIHHPRGFLLAAILTAAVVVAPAGAAIAASDPAAVSTADPGAIEVRLVDVPTETLDAPRAPLHIVDHLAPGTTVERRIEVKNTTAANARVALYPAAATIMDNAFLGAVGRTKNDLSTWTSVSPASSVVPAKGSVEATVTIKVPEDAARGEQYGAVWAEPASAPGAGIGSAGRVGIRLYLDIGAGVAPAPDFTIESLTAERSPDGTPRLIATVHNTGGRALDMGGTLQLRGGPGELSAGPFPVVLGTTLAVGGVAPVAIALDDQVPAGPWDARITLRSGLVEHSAEATLTFPSAGVSVPVALESDHTRWLLLLVGIAVLGLVGAVLEIVRRRRRPGIPAQHPAHARAHAYR